jgi:hypothetical protein
MKQLKRTAMRRVMCIAMSAVLCMGCAEMETVSRPAVGPQSTWEEIRSTPGLVVNAPMIPFGVRAVSVTDVCRSGDRLHAKAVDAGALETAAEGGRLSYTVQVGRIMGDGENGGFRALFAKSFEVPPCP